MDRRDRIAAYELLFRDCAEAASAEVTAPAQATARVAIETISTLGTSAVLGVHPGFLNVDLELLASEALLALPTDRIVIEVLETVPPWAASRCEELREHGFRIALDDYVPGDPRASMIELADYIKVDLTLTEPAALGDLVAELRRSPAELVAEKVETREEFDRCLELGFDLFQGYFFAKPATLSAERPDHDRAALLRAFSVLSSDTDIIDVENGFKGSSQLCLHLLRLANSAGMGARQKVTDLRHAIMYIGRVQLRRWVLLMLYSAGDTDIASDPLTTAAALRGRFLELLVDAVDPEAIGRDTSKESAFLVGMLSLADALLGRPLDSILGDLHLDDSIRRAVLERKGALGTLLTAVESLEEGRFHVLTELLDECGIRMERFVEAQADAYKWVNAYVESMTPSGAPTTG